MLDTIEDTTGAPRAAAGGQALVLFAVIKSALKYAYQGRIDRKPVAMRVTFLENTDYAFHLENGNRYRREDLRFYVRDGDRLVKLR